MEVSPEEDRIASEEDIELIALVTMAEAEGEPEEGKRLVIDTILNSIPQAAVITIPAIDIASSTSNNENPPQLPLEFRRLTTELVVLYAGILLLMDSPSPAHIVCGFHLASRCGRQVWYPYRNCAHTNFYELAT